MESPGLAELFPVLQPICVFPVFPISKGPPKPACQNIVEIQNNILYCFPYLLGKNQHSYKSPWRICQNTSKGGWFLSWWLMSTAASQGNNISCFHDIVPPGSFQNPPQTLWGDTMKRVLNGHHLSLTPRHCSTLCCQPHNVNRQESGA